MSVISNSALAGSSGQGGGAAGYEIERSLRFNSADSSYLNRTPSSAGNQKTFTWSGWVKLSQDASAMYFFGTNTQFVISFTAANKLDVQNYTSGSNHDLRVTTNRSFRDQSAWYHLVVSIDTTQATASDRAKIYINGTLETSFATATYPSQNFDCAVNTTVQHAIGTFGTSTSASFDGYMADINFIDGVSGLTASDFGEYDDNNVWQPIKYAGTYGTNGFKLDFSDNSSNAALGTDTSGNGNDWTVNNLSVAAGAGNDALRDSPVNGDSANDTGAGGEITGNYAVMNPLKATANLSNGNLTISPIVSHSNSYATLGVNTGKYYWEITRPSYSGNLGSIGIHGSTSASKSYGTGWAAPGSDLDQKVYYVNAPSSGIIYNIPPGGTFNISNSSTPTLPTGWNSDAGTYMFCLDMDNQKAWMGRNGVWWGYTGSTVTTTGGNPATGANALWVLDSSLTYFPFLGLYGTGYSYDLNFGQRPFAYTAPSGYKCLNTANLPDPTIADGSTAMDVVTYDGTQVTRSITGLDFGPDLVWTKSRSNTTGHELYDSVRGAQKLLYSNLTDAETTVTNGISSFNSDGWTMGNRSGLNYLSRTYVAWAWDAGSSTVTNTDGSISAQVRANPSAGFSIVSYSGNPAGAKVIAHGLSAKPYLIIVKNRTNSAFDWPVYHNSIGVGSSTSLKLNLPDAATHNYFPTEPTSSVFYTTSSGAVGGGASDDMIAYCFAPVEGYSAFGSYTGNGVADGSFVYTGFAPAFVLIKNTSVSGTFWTIFDNKRGSGELYPSETNSETYYPGNTTPRVLLTSNGFKMNAAQNTFNGSGNVMIYAAFAEHPVKTSRAR